MLTGTKWPLFSTIFVAFLGCLPHSLASSSQSLEALKTIDTILSVNHKILVQIDQKLSQSVQQKHPGALPANFESKIQDLSKTRREYVLRQDFWDRLKFQIDTHYKRGNFKRFIIARLKKMTLIELQSEQSPMWKFLKYLTISMENLMEPNEDPIDFIQGYLRQSNLINPTPPQTYRQTRHYSNGVDNEGTHPIKPENLGEEVEKRLKALEPLAAPPAQPPAYEAGSAPETTGQKDSNDPWGQDSGSQATRPSSETQNGYEGRDDKSSWLPSYPSKVSPTPPSEHGEEVDEKGNKEGMDEERKRQIVLPYTNSLARDKKSERENENGEEPISQPQESEAAPLLPSPDDEDFQLRLLKKK